MSGIEKLLQLATNGSVLNEMWIAETHQECIPTLNTILIYTRNT